MLRVKEHFCHSLEPLVSAPLSPELWTRSLTRPGPVHTSGAPSHDFVPPLPPVSWSCKGSERSVREMTVVSVVTLKTIDHERSYQGVGPT